MVRAGAAERKRRKASDEVACARGRLTAIAYDQVTEYAAVCSDNSGRVGGQPAVSHALAATLAALREINGLSYRGLHGHLEELTHGRRTLSAPRLCRRTSAMGIGAFRGGLRVGGSGASFRGQDGGIVIAVRRARRGGRARPETAIGCHNGMAVITAGLRPQARAGRRHRCDVPTRRQQGRRQARKVGPGAGRETTTG